MERKLYKCIAGFNLALLLIAPPLFAQREPKAPPAPIAPPQPEMPLAFPDGFNMEFKYPDLKEVNRRLKDVNVRLKAIDRKELEKLNLAMADLNEKLCENSKYLERRVEKDSEKNKKFEKDLEKRLEKNFEGFDRKFKFDYDDNYTQGAEKTKIISKTYTVDSKDKLSIDNQYGKVIINVWPKNEVKVDIEIKAYEASDSKAQDLLDDVNIAESRTNDLISFKTTFERKNMNWWSKMSKDDKENRRGVQVNYVVYMPAKNPLDITNRYGSTIIPDFSGPVNINSSYGSFTAQSLDHPANRVKVSYGSANIENFSSGNLMVSYGSLKLTNADKLTADISYGSAKIARLTNNGDLNIRYTGGFKIDEVDKNVKNLIINSSYSGVTLGIDEAANFDFDVTVNYAGFNYNSNKVNITSKTPEDKERGWNPTKNYKGHYGKGSDSNIIIKSNYSGVRFL